MLNNVIIHSNVIKELNDLLVAQLHFFFLQADNFMCVTM